MALFAFHSVASSCSNCKTHLHRFASSTQHKRASVCVQCRRRALQEAFCLRQLSVFTGAKSERVSEKSTDNDDDPAEGRCCFYQADVEIPAFLRKEQKSVKFKAWTSHLRLKGRVNLKYSDAAGGSWSCSTPQQFCSTASNRRGLPFAGCLSDLQYPRTIHAQTCDHKPFP